MSETLTLRSFCISKAECLACICCPCKWSKCPFFRTKLAEYNSIYLGASMHAFLKAKIQVHNVDLRLPLAPLLAPKPSPEQLLKHFFLSLSLMASSSLSPKPCKLTPEVFTILVVLLSEALISCGSGLIVLLSFGRVRQYLISTKSHYSYLLILVKVSLA